MVMHTFASEYLHLKQSGMRQSLGIINIFALSNSKHDEKISYSFGNFGH